MRVGVFLFGGVEMDTIGAGPPAPTERRYGADQTWQATERVLDMGVVAETANYEFFMFTEHHFMHEGYEVIPNPMLFGSVLAERTERIHIGELFNIVPQWHPLRFAEDFASLVNLSKGRAILGVGRGSVQRESIPLGSTIASAEDPKGRSEADRQNRELFGEALEIIRLALDNETFAYHGEHFVLPQPGIPDRGKMVETLTLVPRPLYPYEIWQAVSSPPTLEYVPRQGWGGVFAHTHHLLIDKSWSRFAEIYEETHGVALAPGEKRMLVVDTFVADSHEEAMAGARPSHDEYIKFLLPYGWLARGYRDSAGNPYPDGFTPTLEDSIEQRWCMVGTAEAVAEGIANRIDALGGVEDLAIMPICLGASYDLYEQQIMRFAKEVRPLL